MFQLQCERHRLMNGSDQCSLRASTSEAQDMGNHTIRNIESKYVNRVWHVFSIFFFLGNANASLHAVTTSC